MLSLQTYHSPFARRSHGLALIQPVSLPSPPWRRQFQHPAPLILSTSLARLYLPSNPFVGLSIRHFFLCYFFVNRTPQSTIPTLQPSLRFWFIDHPSPSPSSLVDSDGAGPGTREALCAAVFAGPLQRRHPGVGTRAVARTLWVQRRESANWTAFDYDEEAGRVALGLSDGRVEVLDLV